MSILIVDEPYSMKERLIHDLSTAYDYEPWRVRIFDMQRASVQLPLPPIELVPEDLREKFQHATIIMQGNGFTFTSSETSSINSDWGGLVTPYQTTVGPASQNYPLQLSYFEHPVLSFDMLRLLDIMGRSSIHYFPFKDKDTGKALHKYLVVNPYENCSYRCRACSRLPFFQFAPQSYEANIQATIQDVLSQVETPNEVKFINIITGSQPDAKSDLAMFTKIIHAFRTAGFTEAEFGVYTPNIEKEEDMQYLHDLGVVFFTVTLETTTPESRALFYGKKNAKGRMTFRQIIDVMKLAETIFPYVNTNIMLGYEPIDELKSNLDILVQETEATVNHFIPRIFLRKQLELIHAEAHTLEYYVDMCAFMERQVNAGRKNFGAFFQERFGIPQFGNRFRS